MISRKISVKLQVFNLNLVLVTVDQSRQLVKLFYTWFGIDLVNEERPMIAFEWLRCLPGARWLSLKTRNDPTFFFLLYERIECDCHFV